MGGFERAEAETLIERVAGGRKLPAVGCRPLRQGSLPRGRI